MRNMNVGSLELDVNEGIKIIVIVKKKIERASDSERRRKKLKK
jgi:hypothetical protein